MTKYYLQQYFGQAVDLEYVDMFDPKNQEEYSELYAQITERDLAYPLVAFDGRVQLAGSAQYYDIMPVVADLLEETREQDPVQES